jgi:hypothetical protein
MKDTTMQVYMIQNEPTKRYRSSSRNIDKIKYQKNSHTHGMDLWDIPRQDSDISVSTLKIHTSGTISDVMEWELSHLYMADGK